MSWHYQIRKRTNINGQPWYDIVEVFTRPKGWTEDGIEPGSETRAGLIQVLRDMLTDAEHYRTLVEK